MAKVSIEHKTLVYPMPSFLIGANVDDKPNFMTAAWCGIAAATPPAISVAIRPERFTFEGISANNTFSINIPSADMAEKVDYCGIYSGHKVDKSQIFEVAYGKLHTAPLIEACPVNLECKVAHILNLGTNSLVIGEIEEVHVSDDCLTDGKPDPIKINPLTFIGAPERKYRALGEIVAEAYSIGNRLKGS